MSIIKIKLVFATFVFIIVTLFLFRSELKNAKRNAKYTVAYIISDWHQKNNNGVGTYFSYYVNGKRIDRTCASSLKKEPGIFCYMILYTLKII
ncbi:hypothetical protein M2373_000429 [Chryseobacterium sp. JUb7]|nr:hypothetical protein [Chryseobacterium sp. JUb7]